MEEQLFQQRPLFEHPVIPVQKHLLFRGKPIAFTFPQGTDRLGVELFLHYFRIPEEEEVCEPLSAPEILMTISKQSKIDLTETKLRLFGQLMQKYNVRKKMKKDRKYYYVIPETEEPGADVPVG